MNRKAGFCHFAAFGVLVLLLAIWPVAVQAQETTGEPTLRYMYTGGETAQGRQEVTIGVTGLDRSMTAAQLTYQDSENGAAKTVSATKVSGQEAVFSLPDEGQESRIYVRMTVTVSGKSVQINLRAPSQSVADPASGAKASAGTGSAGSSTGTGIAGAGKGSAGLSMTPEATKVVVLDPGHGGHDSGAVGTLNSTGVTYYEKTFNLKIAKYTKQALEENYKNVKVYLTRSTDVFIELEDRPAIAENYGADLFLSQHINSLSNTGVKGALIYVPYNSSYRPELTTKARNAGTKVLNQLVSLGFVNKGFLAEPGAYYYPDGSSADYLSVIRNCKRRNLVGILAEHGFISNQTDLAYLSKDANLKKIGAADARGVAEYLGLTGGSSTSTDDTAADAEEEKKEEVTGTFTKLDDKTYYLLSDNSYYTGWLTYEGGRYYFSSTGEMQTGLKTIGGKSYYFNSSGKMVTGAKTIEGSLYYFDKTSGAMSTNVVKKVSGTYYYFSNSGTTDKTGWVTVSGTKYYLNSAGACETGWQKIGTKTYYFDEAAKMQTGLLTSGNKKYYMNANGVMQTSKWMNVNGSKYYLSAAGTAVKGWQKINGMNYYFTSSCEVKTGWVKKDGKTYYMTRSGIKTGWLNVNGKKYYLKANGTRTTGLSKVNGNRYYFSASGVMQKGWKLVNNRWYYFNSGGAARTSSWLRWKGVWYYLQENGVMAKSKALTINGTRYRFSSAGAML